MDELSNSVVFDEENGTFDDDNDDEDDDARSPLALKIPARACNDLFRYLFVQESAPVLPLLYSALLTYCTALLLLLPSAPPSIFLLSSVAFLSPHDLQDIVVHFRPNGSFLRLLSAQHKATEFIIVKIREVFVFLPSSPLSSLSSSLSSSDPQSATVLYQTLASFDSSHFHFRPDPHPQISPRPRLFILVLVFFLIATFSLNRRLFVFALLRSFPSSSPVASTCC